MKRGLRTLEQLKDAAAFDVASVRDESHRLALEAQAPLLPPHDRVRNHAADELLALLTCDAAETLIAACADPEVDRTAKELLGALVSATEKRLP